ncbi:bile acid:sodium symporter [Solimonas variicoloris]|uniref:bile acid:sodium symporter n=1 Tax=Solimonas variicoloris TaxID=254408 RepID=UPI00037277E4|nr:bile acid:sodium symporter [Solimonas variicoloris]
MFEALDQAVVLFSPAQLRLMNIAQALMMFVVSLHLDLGGLRRVGEHPRAVLAALAAQWLLVPVLALLAIVLLRLPSAPALGLLLIACCPGGSAAAFLSLFARGHAAVAVAATTVSTLATALLTPLLFALTRALAGLDGAATGLELDTAMVVRTALVYLLLPLGAGLALQRWRPRLATRLRGPLKLALGVTLGVFLLGAVQANARSLQTLVLTLTPLVGGFHGAVLLGSWLLAAALRLPAPERRAITLSAGISNAGLSLLLVFSFFGGNGAMAALVAWWGVWRLLACGALTLGWAWRAPAAAQAPSGGSAAGASAGGRAG